MKKTIVPVAKVSATNLRVVRLRNGYPKDSSLGIANAQLELGTSSAQSVFGLYDWQAVHVDVDAVSVVRLWENVLID